MHNKKSEYSHTCQNKAELLVFFLFITMNFIHYTYYNNIFWCMKIKKVVVLRRNVHFRVFHIDKNKILKKIFLAKRFNKKKFWSKKFEIKLLNFFILKEKLYKIKDIKRTQNFFRKKYYQNKYLGLICYLPGFYANFWLQS